MQRHAFALAGILLVLLSGAADAAGDKRRNQTIKTSPTHRQTATEATAQPPRASVPVAPIYDWTGLYLGLNGGGTWGHSTWSSPPTGDFNVAGGLIGGTVGYNWQTGKMVFGAEADLAASTAKGNSAANCPNGCETSQNWLGTARGRVGYAFDRFLPYLTAGGAAADIKANRPGFAGASMTKFGWTAGAGLEFSVKGNWTAKAEYLHIDLGDMACGTACGTASNSVTLRENVVRAGLNYRF